MKMNYTEAFARYGATLRNNMWSVGALNDKQELVLSAWENQLTFDGLRKRLVYTDQLSAWLGNEPGRSELKRLLELAKEKSLPVRIVIAHPEGERAQAQVGKISDESLIRKSFSVRPELRGTITDFDGDRVSIEFARELT